MGMEGWFSQEVHLLFRASFDHAEIPFNAVGLWDCHPEGRAGKILDRAVHRQRLSLHISKLSNHSGAWWQKSDIPMTLLLTLQLF